jgi:hypothetical protein
MNNVPIGGRCVFKIDDLDQPIQKNIPGVNRQVSVSDVDRWAKQHHLRSADQAILEFWNSAISETAMLVASSAYFRQLSMR